MGALSSGHVLCCPTQRENRDQAGVLGGAVQVREGMGLNHIPDFLVVIFCSDDNLRLC